MTTIKPTPSSLTTVLIVGITITILLEYTNAAHPIVVGWLAHILVVATLAMIAWDIVAIRYGDS